MILRDPVCFTLFYHDLGALDVSIRSFYNELAALDVSNRSFYNELAALDVSNHSFYNEFALSALICWVMGLMYEFLKSGAPSKLDQRTSIFQ